MPTKKIADAPPPPCRHPEHKPPSHRVFQPGTYQHTCPRCGQTTPFVVHRTQLSGKQVLERSQHVAPFDPAAPVSVGHAAPPAEAFQPFLGGSIRVLQVNGVPCLDDGQWRRLEEVARGDASPGLVVDIDAGYWLGQVRLVEDGKLTRLGEQALEQKRDALIRALGGLPASVRGLESP